MFKVQFRFLMPRLNENFLHAVQEQGNPDPQMLMVKQMPDNSPGNSSPLQIKAFQKIPKASPEFTVPAPKLLYCHHNSS